MERDDLKAPLLDPPPAAAPEVATTAAEGETGAPPPPHPPPPPPPPPPPSAAAYKGATSAAKGKSALADDDASPASSTPSDSGGCQETHQDGGAQVVEEGTGGRIDGEQSRGWLMWLLRRRPPTSPTLPVTQPRQSGDSIAKKFRDWVEPKLGEMLPDSLVTKRLAAFGFVLYGVASILSNTLSLMKDAGVSVGLRQAVLLCVGLIWILASIGVPCTLYGRTSWEHHVSQHTARLGLLGIALLISLHIGWMLPNNFWRPNGDYLSFWSAGGFVFLLCLGVLGHVVSWAVSLVSGEESTKPSASA